MPLVRLIGEKGWRICEAKGLRGRTVTLKVRYADFRQIARGRWSARPIASREGPERVTRNFPDPLRPVSKGVRLLGPTVSSFTAETTEATEMQFSLPL